MFLKLFYFFNAIISVFTVVYYFETTLNKVNQKQLLILVFTALANWAYCFAANAKSLEAYIVGYNMYYSGITFALILMVLIINELCGYKDNKYLRRFLFVYAIVIIWLVATIPNSKLYYKSYEFAQSRGIAYLIKEYGPLHNLLLGLIFGSIIFCYIITIFAHIKKRAISVGIMVSFLSVYTLIVFVYFIPKIFNLHLESMPFSFTILDIFLVNIFRRTSMYDMSSNLLSVYEQRSEFGYIALDRKFRFLGASDLALSLFPELKEISIDSKIDCPGTDLSEKLMKWVYEECDNKKKAFVYTKDAITVSFSIGDIITEKKKFGYLLEMKDVSKQQQYIDLINTYNIQLETKVEEKTLKLQQVQDSIISGMAMMVESRDNSTGGHIKRTSEGVKIFIEELNNLDESENKWYFSENFCKKIIKAAPMHDLGKIAVDDVILRKPGKFEPEEYEQMKKHSSEGARIVSQVLLHDDDDEFVQIAVNVAHYHHEKWNGTGYPEGLKEEAIPVEARIMAFADVFDALVSKRCYKDSFTFDRAFEIIEHDLGSHFDPELGKVFLKCRPKLEAYYSKLGE